MLLLLRSSWTHVGQGRVKARGRRRPPGGQRAALRARHTRAALIPQLEVRTQCLGLGLCVNGYRKAEHDGYHNGFLCRRVSLVLKILPLPLLLPLLLLLQLPLRRLIRRRVSILGVCWRSRRRSSRRRRRSVRCTRDMQGLHRGQRLQPRLSPSRVALRLFPMAGPHGPERRS